MPSPGTRWSHIADGWRVNFADRLPRPHGAASHVLYRFGRQVGDPDVIRQARALPGDQAAAELISGANGSVGRTLSALADARWADEPAGSFPMSAQAWLAATGFPAARSRAGTSAGLFLAPKAGHNGESRNHNDLGSLIVVLDGRPLIIDVGVGVYTRQTFGPGHYEIWTMQSSWHNVPEVDAVPQAARVCQPQGAGLGFSRRRRAVHGHRRGLPARSRDQLVALDNTRTRARPTWRSRAVEAAARLDGPAQRTHLRLKRWAGRPPGPAARTASPPAPASISAERSMVFRPGPARLTAPWAGCRPAPPRRRAVPNDTERPGMLPARRPRQESRPPSPRHTRRPPRRRPQVDALYGAAWPDPLAVRQQRCVEAAVASCRADHFTADTLNLVGPARQAGDEAPRP